jgi:CRISPR-associated endonuclease Cas1
MPRAETARVALADYIHTCTALQASTIVTTPQALRLLEGRAADAYFAAWNGFSLRWRVGDKRKIPPHWLQVRERSSSLGSARNRHAVDPVNALLNYAYGVLEGQCRTALLAHGFDIACGILHADKHGRDSLVYDLMELFRPVVDGFVLNLLGKTTFSYGDFVRANDGACRLHPQLARYVVATCRVSDQAVRDEACRLRNQLLSPIHLTGLPA